MKYIGVTTPESDTSIPIFNYLNTYLISLGEAASTQN